MAGRTALTLLLLGIALVAATAAPLPEGTSGIASRYPSDAGIASDPAVIFADGFESYSGSAGLTSRWNEAYHTANIRLATEAGNVFFGGKSLEFTVPKTSGEVSNTVVKFVSPEPGRPVPALLRQVRRGIQRARDPATTAAPSRLSIVAPAFAPTATTSFWSVTKRGGTASPPRIPGRLNAYIYHPEQRDIWGDHFFPTGSVLPFSSLPFDFGPEFVSRPDVIPVLGRWYRYEFMVRANTPGQRNGRIAFWLDGQLIADFPNLRFRDTTALKIDRFTLDLHVFRNNLAVARKWYDNVVAATSYIGPMASAQVPTAPTGLRIAR